MRPYSVAILALAAARLLPGNPPVFSVESVLASLKGTHPEASRVTDDLPPGVTARENLTYVERDGRPLRLDLYRPADSDTYPAVLIVHGGGWIAGDRTMERPFARHLAARGYVAVPVSYRLGAEGRFPSPVFDLKEAVRWLRTHAADFGIDGTRVAIAGGSAGATLATMVGVTNHLPDWEGLGGSLGQSSAVHAVVNIDGTVTFLDNRLIAQAEQVPSPYWEYVHGIYSEHRAIWLAASPLCYVSPRSAPTLFITSTASQPVLAGREEMCQRLRLMGVESEMIEIPDTPHPFWLVHPWFERVVEETDAFLRRQMKAPSKQRDLP